MTRKPSHLRIVSWNVNGLRAASKKGFLEWLKSSRADVVALQEVRAMPSQLPHEVLQPEGWYAHFVPGTRPGYSGVAFYTRHKFDAVGALTLGTEFDNEGRLIEAHIGPLRIVNGYFPNGNGKDRGNSRVPYKLDFYRTLFDRLETEKKAGHKILVLGDFNTAHREIDLARPKDNRTNSGFLPEECEELDRWLQQGWTDTFRHYHSAGGQYTWWSNMRGARERNVGWRIDYVLASPSAMDRVHSAFIDAHTEGSDHCPVGVEVAL